MTKIVIEAEDPELTARLWNLCNAINALLAGVPEREAQTALSFAICCCIMNYEPQPDDERKVWKQMCHGHARQVWQMLSDAHFVEHIREHTTYVPPGHA